MSSWWSAPSSRSRDVDEVLATVQDPATAKAAATERARARALGVSSYPTLLVDTPNWLAKIGSRVSSAQQLSAAAAQAMSA
jgi:protein-disulfide isomerase-like protein with CxxC motif